MRKNPNEFTFWEHLDELRSRLVKIIITICCACIASYSFVDPLLSYLIKPVGHVAFTSPADAFVAKVLLTIVLGILLSSPIVVYQIWKFIATGLREAERRYIKIFGPLSLIFFLCGAAFGYFVAIPISLNFLLGFATDQIVPMITINNYISYIGSLVIAFGVVFEMPLVLMFLAKIGIATPEFLIQKRRYSIVLIFIVSAIFTPPDVVSQMVMAVPLLILYELGIVFAKLATKETHLSSVKS
jgi:sec-independent protein translocase protein TatC